MKWTGWALVLNLFWELAQLPLYSYAMGTGLTGVTWGVIHCTAGDAVIALVSFVAAALVTRSSNWPAQRPWPGLLVAGAVGVLWTVYAEWQNVYVRGAWEYAPSMPTIFGIGVLPLLQWVAVPGATLWLVRRFTTNSERCTTSRPS